jgi:amino acid adenylation domain-containing protein
MTQRSSPEVPLIDWPRRSSIHSLIDEQAARTPDAIAVSCGGETMTYGELKARSQALAQDLIALGVKPDDLVPICVTRSVNIITGLLAILKAGGAYVPIDPNYPPDRIAYMLENVSSPLLLTETSLLGTLPPQNAQTVLLDGERTAGAAAFVAPELTGENLAYVIYTSGSTGKPKGVLVSHRNLLYSTAARVDYYGAGHTNFLLLSSYAFDSSVAGLFWMLTTGGTLTLLPEETQMDLDEVDRLIVLDKITTLLCVPSLYMLLLERWQGKPPPSLTAVIVAGESCAPNVVEKHQAVLPGAVLYNEYGPTEATVWTTVFRCDQPTHGKSVPIGKAIAHAQVYLLDPSARPVPIGVIGELWIGGEGLARGYWKAPEMTAEKFVPSPLAGGARLYRTGDFGRFLPDGNIEFHGRRDDQVKVHGYRIELGEVEAALGHHPRLREVAVIPRNDVGASTALVAYYVENTSTEAAPAPLATELRSFLETKLPVYMVPTIFEPLADLPRTPNGKVNRKALPAPKMTAAAKDRTIVAPRTPVEAKLVEIWKDVLEQEAVSVEDNIFEIGGDSLLIIKVASRAKQMGLSLTVRQFFQYKTIASLAATLEQSPSEPVAATGPQLTAVSRDRFRVQR